MDSCYSLRCLHSAKVHRLREQVVATTSLERSVAQHKALGHPTRLQVISILAVEECCVCDLVNVLEVPASTLSQHLKVLKQAGLVCYRRVGKFVHYSLSDSAVLDAFRLTEV